MVICQPIQSNHASKCYRRRMDIAIYVRYADSFSSAAESRSAA